MARFGSAGAGQLQEAKSGHGKPQNAVGLCCDPAASRDGTGQRTAGLQHSWVVAGDTLSSRMCLGQHKRG